jgi:4-amino-4-deoxy-L-arabinose transferase-like glycosyltransferase
MTDAVAGERTADMHADVAEREGRQTGLATWVFLASAAAAVSAGVAIRIARLGEKVLSFDEAYTLATAQRSFGGMLEAFRFEANGTLYAVLLWPLLRLSESEEMVRTLALIAGLATIAATYWTGRAFAERRVALVGAALVSISPALIGWSVYGRAYAFAILFAVLSFGCLARALDDPAQSRRWRWLYVAATLAMAYSSVLAAVTLLPVHAAAVVTRVRGSRSLWAWTRSSLALAAGLVPLGVLLVLESSVRDPLAWLWKPDLTLVRRVSGELAAGPAFFAERGPGLAAVSLAAILAIAVTGAALSWHRGGTPSWRTGVVLGWALWPPLLLFVASQVRPMFWARYLGVVIPAVALLVAVLLVRMPRPLGVAYGVMLGTILVTAALTTSPPFNDFHKKASWVEARRGPGEPLVLYPVEQLPALAYYARSLRVGDVVPVEEWDDTPLPEGLHGYRRDYDWGDSPVGPPTAEDLTHLTAETGSVIVLTYPNLVEDVPVAWAAGRRCDTERVQFAGLTALSFRNCALERA